MLAELLDAVISAGEFEELPLTAHQKGTFFPELRAWRGQARVAEQRKLWGIFLYGAGGFYTDSGECVFTFSCDSARTLFGVEGWRYARGSKRKSANELLSYCDDDADSSAMPGMGCPAVVVYIRPARRPFSKGLLSVSTHSSGLLSWRQRRRKRKRRGTV
mmetsp:Transcript_1141/g.2396  ORF Transcript_1141/g.2396 Transcript_1141/m.2396 type:complete len:160 (-) Transcript_1141:3702-4181(-)